MIPSEDKLAEIRECVGNRYCNSGKNSEESYQQGDLL